MSVDKDDHYKQELTFIWIAERLPVRNVRVTNIYDEERTNTRHVLRACLVIGSNRTSEDLQRTQDIGLIEQYQAVLGPNAQLKWHKFARD